MSDSINEQRCERNGLPISGCAASEYDCAKFGVCAAGPSVVTPPAQDEQPQYEYRRKIGKSAAWHTSVKPFMPPSAAMPNVTDEKRLIGPWIPAAPSVSTDRTDERRAALADLEHVLTLALCEIDDEDKAAAVEQFRGDMLALGVRADELDAAGLTEYPPKDTA